MRKLALVVGVLAALWFAPGTFAAGWCGTGETATDLPDTVTARQIHTIVAVPSDAPDQFAAQANQVADDVTSMVGWWAGQDPTRIPRFDQALFNGSQCVDISFVRLPSSTAAYAGTGANADFRNIELQLVGDGFDGIYKKYLVYFFGSTADDGVCGVGSGDIDTGPSFAVVISAGCSVVPSDTTATHELLHALGAVPPGDPHCPADPGHPCDSPTDVLYPYTGGEPLSTKVLDFNHDDYYGHSQSWPDIQDSLWLHRLDVPQVGLTIAFSGAGSVTSDLPGVSCAAACTTQWDSGSVVQLEADPAATDRFVRWTGACTGRTDCSLTLAEAATVSAVFGPLRIPVRLSTTGQGKVTCTPKCAKTFTAGNTLRLTAVAATGWKFAGWAGGACKGTRSTCTPATDYALTVKARFTRKR
ncbi:MAG TPA: hypothetical protein VLK36_13115 [Gaiellaceae bacterium]|nr:hypothetical protein [Gaiellaceae bacterium]